MIFHLFLNIPSVVMSGDKKSMSSASTCFLKAKSPNYSEKPLSKKFTDSHCRSEPTGLIQ